MVRAKFTVTSVAQQVWWPARRSIVLSPVYDQNIPEDRRYSQATPSGEMRLDVDNPAAIEQLQLGKTFYVDFTPAE